MINKKLIHFNTYSAFEANKSQLYDWTIAFIGETKQIYTHGNFYDCDIEDINNINEILTYHGINVYKGIYIATNNGELILPEEWDASDNDNAVGVAVITDNSSYIIGRISTRKSVKWSDDLIDVSGVPTSNDESIIITYFDGVLYTDAMIAAGSNYNTTDYAAGYVRSKQIIFGNNTLVGYLGSTGEWQDTLNNFDAVSNAFTVIGEQFVSGNMHYQTSCEYSQYIQWRITYDNGKYSLNKSGFKSTVSSIYAIPFYQLPSQSIKDKLALLEQSIPTKVSQLENDSNYITESELTDRGYTTNTGTVTSVTAGTGLTGGTISTSGTIALDDSGATAGSYGPSSTSITGNNGISVSVPYITVDKHGRVTSITNRTYYSVNTTYSAMTASEATSGTSTSTRVITPKVLHDKIVDTAVVNDGNILNIAKVSSLPSSPDANTLYIIP